MVRLVGLALVCSVALTLPGRVVAKEPEGPGAAAPEQTPWAAVRERLRERAEKKRPRDLRLDSWSKRELHESVPGAIDAALRWLAAHQSPDGRWEAAGYREWCNGEEVPFSDRADGPGRTSYDVGVTGLALSAFLVAGHTPLSEHAFGKTVKEGLGYLMRVQDEEGCFGARENMHFVYNHATAALALVEACGLTGSPVYKGSAQKALDFIELARNPYYAWRYGVKPGDNDTSATGWMMMPLQTARLINRACAAAEHPAPFVIEEAAFDGIQSWIGLMTDQRSGKTGYMQRGGPSTRDAHLRDHFDPRLTEALTAIGLLARVFCGESPSESKQLELGAGLLEALPPDWDGSRGSIDLVYWHFGTLAMHQIGTTKRSGARRKRWSEWFVATLKALLEHQEREGGVCTEKGSWDPIGVWGSEGGRVYATALNTLTLLTRARYEVEMK